MFVLGSQNRAEGLLLTLFRNHYFLCSGNQRAVGNVTGSNVIQNKALWPSLFYFALFYILFYISFFLRIRFMDLESEILYKYYQLLSTVLQPHSYPQSFNIHFQTLAHSLLPNLIIRIFLLSYSYIINQKLMILKP